MRTFQSMMFGLVASFALAALVASAPANAASLYSTFGAGNTFDSSVIYQIAGDTSSLAQANYIAAPFTVNANSNGITADLALAFGSGTNNITASIVNNNGGNPSDVSILGTASRNNINTAAVYTFTFTPSLALVTGTNYWLVLKPTVTTGSALHNWFGNTQGVNGISTNNGNSGWNAGIGSTAPAFRVNGSAVAVPEAGSTVLLVAGIPALAGLVLARRKRAA